MSKIPYILTDAGRFSDLMKQGFMRSVYAKPARKSKPVVRVSCCGCQNWHVKGQHIELDADVRKTNLARYRANDRKHPNWDGKLRPMETPL
jgi:hypothetical protein